MKAAEMRINSLLEYSINDSFSDRVPYFGKSIFRVAVIMDDSVKLDIGHGALQRVMFDDPKLKPIPLTKDLLVRFGFKKAGMYYVNDAITAWMFSDYYVFSARYIGNKAKAFRYVHQLQNLFYSLTGRELTINTQKQ